MRDDADLRRLSFAVEEGLVGGASYDVHGTPLTDATMARAQTVDAVLLIQNLPCLQVLIVSRVLYLEMVNVQVTLTLSLLH